VVSGSAALCYDLAHFSPRLSCVTSLRRMKPTAHNTIRIKRPRFPGEMLGHGVRLYVRVLPQRTATALSLSRLWQRQGERAQRPRPASGKRSTAGSPRASTTRRPAGRPRPCWRRYRKPDRRPLLAIPPTQWHAVGTNPAPTSAALGGTRVRRRHVEMATKS